MSHPTRRGVPRRWPAATAWCRSGRSCSPTSSPRRGLRPPHRSGEPGFLLESVEHGERWSRWSFVGRRPPPVPASSAPPSGRRDPTTAGGGRGPGRSRSTRGILATVQQLLDAYRSPSTTNPAAAARRGGRVPRLRRGARGRAPPDVPTDDRGLARRRRYGDRRAGAFDHWSPAGDPDLERVRARRLPPTTSSNELYDAAVDRASMPGRRRGHADRRADGVAARPLRPLPDVTSSMGAGASTRPRSRSPRSTSGRRHLPGRAGPALRLRARRRPVRRLPGAAPDQPEPVHVLHPGPRCAWWVLARADGAAARTARSSRGPSPAPGSAGRPTSTTAARGRAARAPQGAAEHVMLVDLARNDVGRVVEFGTERVDEMMTLERYSHVMHLTSQVSGSWPRAGRPSTCCGPRCPPARCRAHRRCGPWRSSTTSSRPSAGPTPGSSGYLDFSGNIDTAIAIRTMVCLPDGRACVQAGAGVVVDSVPAHEELPQQGPGPAGRGPGRPAHDRARRAGTASD
jgi:anthranilate synthase component 1